MSSDQAIDLDIQIHTAHEACNGEALAVLYRDAGLAEESLGNTDAACYFFTLAYVFALEVGDDVTAIDVRARLVGYGREA